MTTSTKRPTVKDVAKLAKVHFTTVSLALRGHPRIPAATRERILRAAEAIGYKRDPVFMALTSRRGNARVHRQTPSLAFLTNRPDEDAFEQYPHLRYFYEGAKRQAEAMGYACSLYYVGGKNLTSQELSDKLTATNCEGIIVGAMEPNHGTISLDWSRYALVKIDTRFMSPAATLITNDQLQVVRVGFQRLRALGYRRIGMAVGRSDEDSTHDLFASGCYIEQAGMPPKDRVPPLHFDYGSDAINVAPTLRQWIKETKVRAVVSNWANIAELIRDCGFRVPEEVACACISLNDPDPLLAGVIQNHRIVGQKAAETLARLLKTGQRGAPHHPTATYVEGFWQDGASAPPLL